MFEHIVLLKFKPDVTNEEKESAIKSVHGFKGNIPGIVELSAGINVTEEIEHIQGFTLGIRVTFEDQQACRDYIQHPLHQSLLQSISSELRSQCGLGVALRRSGRLSRRYRLGEVFGLSAASGYRTPAGACLTPSRTK